MDMSKLWKSSEELLEEERVEYENEMSIKLKKAREANLIGDTEVLAEMVMMTMMDSMALSDELVLLREELEGLRNGQ